MEYKLILASSAFSAFFLACSAGPPVKTATGEVIEEVKFEERDGVGPAAARETTLDGERLRKAVALMDRAELMSADMVGTYQSGAKDGPGTLILTIRAAENRQRTIVVKNCAETHVCSFFAAAVKSEIVNAVPAVCRDAIRCLDEPLPERIR